MIFRRHLCRVCTVLVLLCVGASLLACDRGEQPASDIDDRDGSPVTAMAVLDRRIESGKMTSGEAIVASLQVLTGERSHKEVFGADAPPLREGTGVILRARAYLKTGRDEKHKAEIRRLLKVLVPSREELERRSIPEKASKRNTRRPASAGIGRAALRVIPDLVPEARAAGERDLIGRLLNVDGHSYLIHYPRRWAGDPGRLKRVDDVEQALKDSYRAYQGLASPGMRGDIVVLLQTLSTRDYADAIEETGYCHINVYSSALSQQPDKMRQTIAHEVFHCFQFWNMPRQMYGDDSDAWDKYIGWWREGTAEHFSAVVYPCANDEHQYIANFDRHSPSASLLQFDGEVWFFFQFLADRPGMGNRGIIRFLKSGPTRGEWDEQAAHLASVPRMSELFNEFGRAYLDRKLPDSCDGKPIPTHARRGRPLRIKAPGNYEAKTASFTLVRREVEFDDGWEFDIETARDGAPMRDTTRERSSEIWEPFPEKVITSCADDRRKLLLTTTTGDLRATYTFEIAVKSGNPRQVTRARVDKCLIGTWRLENESHDRAADSFMSRLLPAGMNVKTTQNASGTSLLRFDRGCKSSVTYKDWKTIATTSMTIRSRKKGPQTVREVATRVSNGTDTADYAASGGIITFSNFRNGSCEEELSVKTVAGNTVTSRNRTCGKRSGKPSMRDVGRLQSPEGSVDLNKIMAEAQKQAKDYALSGERAEDSRELRQHMEALRRSTGETLTPPSEEEMNLLTGRAAYDCSSRQLRLTVTSGATTFPAVTLKRVGQ